MADCGERSRTGWKGKAEQLPSLGNGTSQAKVETVGSTIWGGSRTGGIAGVRFMVEMLLENWLAGSSQGWR